ncbi:MAG: NAD(P)H-hydrate dehydratase [Chloroflexota bacterium]|nr:NAD(P)H-hydrate dehydratase [Chloroflexota bacterium]
MMLIAGTFPDRDLPLTVGEVRAEDGSLVIGGYRLPGAQGTGAMISAAAMVADYLKLDPPQAVVAGDIGEGKGSRAIYQYLVDNVKALRPEVLALHYWLPDMELTKRLCEAVDKCDTRPMMVADAASMYSAKAAGLAPSFDIFTPDATEIAFLADPDATHPAYIARHLFDTDITQTLRLVEAAYSNGSAARLMLVKGAIDYVVRHGEIVATVDAPDVPALEAIGGTGDTITGLVSAFVYAGLEAHEAAIIAARANRMAGRFAEATPAHKISHIIDQLPAVFRQYLCQWSGVCYMGTEGGHDD